MGLFFCYVCKKEKIAEDYANFISSSPKLLSSSNKSLINIKKSKTFSENQKSYSIKLISHQNIKYPNIKRYKSLPTRKTKKTKVKLEDFNIIRLIGIGSYGKVYVATKDSIDKLYAIKVLNKNKINTKVLKKSINTERTLLANINHPFIMGIT